MPWGDKHTEAEQERLLQLVSDKFTLSEIAETLGRSKTGVAQWLSKLRKNGVTDLIARSAHRWNTRDRSGYRTPEQKRVAARDRMRRLRQERAIVRTAARS